MLITKDKLKLAKYTHQDPGLPKGNLCLDGNKAIATNGHYLFQIEDTPADDLDFPSVGVTLSTPEKVLIKPGTADKVLKNLPKKSPLVQIILNAALGIEKDKVLFGCTDLETTTIIKQRTEPGIYPDTDMVFPTESPSQTIYMDIDYLEKAIKAMREFSDTANRTIKISIYENDASPIIMENKKDSATFTALIMPQNGPKDKN